MTAAQHPRGFDEASTNRRRAKRWPLDAPYTTLRVRRESDPDTEFDGHAYDISIGGMRFELDMALPVGEQVNLELLLPGEPVTAVQGSGTVVRQHDHEEVGPVRMAVNFTQVDRAALEAYLATRR
ncbi:MAG: PilZ domain-containing protein [Phycisphaeraceae bacterium]